MGSVVVEPFDEADGAEHLGHVGGVRYGASAAEGRVAVVELRQGADAALGHLVLEAYEHAVDVAHAAVAEHLEVCLGVESHEPRAGGTLVEGKLAFVGRAEIGGAVSEALGREGAQALGGEQLACDHVEHTLALAAVEGRVVEADGHGHVGTHLGRGVAAVDIVIQVAAVVEEHVDERLAHLFGGVEPLLAARGEVAVVLGQRGGEDQRVVPQGVELDKVARAGNDGAPLVVGVHPRHGRLGAVGGEQAVVGVDAEVGMAVFKDIGDGAGHETGVKLARAFHTNVLGVLLYGPKSPQGDVGQVDAVDAAVEFARVHEPEQGGRRRRHYRLEVGAVVDGEGEARQRHERVAGQYGSPGEAREYIHAVTFLDVELLGRVLEAVEERRARCARLDFGLVHLLEAAGLHLAHAGREDDRLALADGYLEIAGHPQVLAVRHAALKVLDILDAVVPVGLIDPHGFVAELHVEGGVAVIQACGDAIVYRDYIAVDGVVGDAEGVALAEGQKGAEAQRRRRMGLDEGVAYQDAVLVGDEHLFLGEDDAADAVSDARHALAVKLAEIFMAVGAVNASLIAVDAEVEGRAVLYYGLVEARQQHMGLVAHLLYGDDEQAVLLARVATDECGAVVGARLVGAQHFFRQRLFQVDKQVLIKFKVTHCRAMFVFLWLLLSVKSNSYASRK